MFYGRQPLEYFASTATVLLCLEEFAVLGGC